MAHLGIVAHSAPGAALCFTAFCEEGSRVMGPWTHPDVTLDCISFGRCMPAYDRGDYGEVREILVSSLERLAAAGADFFVCPDNTAHLALEAPGNDLPLPGLHIAQVVAAEATRTRRQRVGVLGTAYTMDGPIYPTALAAHGIATEMPDPEDRALINRIIFEELVHGVLDDTSRREYVRVIHDLAAQGCDAVALVCTEIPLLVTPDVSPLPTLDSTRLLAQAALRVAMGEDPMPTWRGGATTAGDERPLRPGDDHVGRRADDRGDENDHHRHTDGDPSARAPAFRGRVGPRQEEAEEEVPE